MGKLDMYVIVMATILILFHFAGLIEQTPNHFLMHLALHPEEIGASSLYTLVLAVFAAAAVVGVVIGTLTHTTPDWVLITTLCTASVALIWDMSALFSSLETSIGTIFATAIIAPFMVLWLYVMVEWWRGRD